MYIYLFLSKCKWWHFKYIIFEFCFDNNACSSVHTAAHLVAVDLLKTNKKSNPRGEDRLSRPRRNEWGYTGLPLDVAIAALNHTLRKVSFVNHLFYYVRVDWSGGFSIHQFAMQMQLNHIWNRRTGTNADLDKPVRSPLNLNGPTGILRCAIRPNTSSTPTPIKTMTGTTMTTEGKLKTYRTTCRRRQHPVTPSGRPLVTGHHIHTAQR